MVRAPLSTLLVSLAIAAPASAQDHGLRDANRISLVFGGHFGGEGSVHADPDGDLELPTFSDDLDPSPVLGLRFTHPMQDYVTLAAEFRMVRWRTDGADDRNTLLDFSVMPAARYVFSAGSIELEPYLGLPLGLSVNILSEDLFGDAGPGKGSVGFNVGVMGGLAINTPVGVGAFLEIGWLHHQVFDKDDADTRYRLVLNQVALHAGVSYAF